VVPLIRPIALQWMMVIPRLLTALRQRLGTPFSTIYRSFMPVPDSEWTLSLYLCIY
jgi:hypothetical protein